VADRRARGVTSHMARNDDSRWRSAIDGRTTRYEGNRVSQNAQRQFEEPLGWVKTAGRIRQTVYRGIRRVYQHLKLTITSSNLIRMDRMLRMEPRGAMR
jgi:hypothetical protein